MSETLHVVAVMQARPGREAELEALLRGLIAPTRDEAGCLAYHLHASPDVPGQFTFIEEWTGRAALEQHFASNHLQSARAKMPELVAGDLDLRLLRRIE